MDTQMKSWLRYLDIMSKFTGLPYDFKNKAYAVNNLVNYMFDRTSQIFEYEGLPDTLPAYELEQLLQCGGFGIVTPVDGDLYAFTGGLGGVLDAYYRPTLATVNNPYLNFNGRLQIIYEAGRRKIDVENFNGDCVVIRNDTNYMGFYPLFSRYATLMTENELTMKIANINMRIPTLVSADDDRTQKSAEAYFERVERGDLGVIGETPFLEGLHTAPYTGQSNQLLTDLIEYEQYIKASWFNEIGLDANYNMKREKLSTTESQMNSDALLPLIDDMLTCRERGLELINKMYGTNISVKLKGVWKATEELIEDPEQNEAATEQNEAATEQPGAEPEQNEEQEGEKDDV